MKILVITLTLAAGIVAGVLLLQHNTASRTAISSGPLIYHVPPTTSFALPEIPQIKTGLILHEPGACPGYTLLAPLKSNMTYLIDLEGRLVHQWKSEYQPAMSAYLLPNGHLLRTGKEEGTQMTAFLTHGAGARVQEFAWDGTLLWDFRYIGEGYQMHHDIKPLPNGNVLLIVWEIKTRDQVIAAGRDPNVLGIGLWVDKIVEVQPTGKTGGNIVWEWHTWDHLIQSWDKSKPSYGVAKDHPELIDLNFAPRHGPMMFAKSPDWTHVNAVDYNPKLDQIMISVHTMDEIWIIDHSTTSQEAAGHNGGHSGKGGDLLYRWGNPQTYGMGDATKKQFFGQHSAGWIAPGLADAGSILVFNNGERRPAGQYSSVDLLVPPLQDNGSYLRSPGMAFGPDQPAWSYMADNPTDFFSIYDSSVQRLPNGNTLICSGISGTIFEITPEKNIVWKYVNPVVPGYDSSHQDSSGPAAFHGGQADSKQGPQNSLFRVMRYAPDYPGLVGKDLKPGEAL